LAFSVLKLEAAHSSKTVVFLHQTTRLHIPDDRRIVLTASVLHHTSVSHRALVSLWSTREVWAGVANSDPPSPTSPLCTVLNWIERHCEVRDVDVKRLALNFHRWVKVRQHEY